MKTAINLRKSIERLILSLEDNNDGKNRIEREFVYFIKMKDVNAFIQNHIEQCEQQEQYEIKIPKVEDSQYTSRIRLRERIQHKDGTEGTPEYILCIKANKDGLEGSIENELTATKEMFDLFKIIAVYGMKKLRCTIPVEGMDLSWEVDIFYDDSKDAMNEWVKIDLEIPSYHIGDIPDVSKFFDYDEAITNQWSERTPEESQKVKDLLDSFKYREVK